MGLFDIFRRKHKEEEQQEQVTPKDQQPAAQTEETPKEVPASVDATGATNESATPVENDQATASEQAPGEETADQTATQELAEEASTETHDVSAAEPSMNAETNAQDGSDQTLSEETTIPDGDEAQEPFEDNAEEPATEETSEEAQVADEKDSDDQADPAAETAGADQDEAEKYDAGLEKSRNGFGARLNKFLANFRHVDEDFFEDLEDMLIESDVGYDMAMKLSDSLREEVKLQNAKSKQDVSNVIIQKMVELYDEAGEGEETGISFAENGPTVIMFVGVNGAGKTTTIGKMAARFKNAGKKVLLAAADTFRAGATEQLDVWAKRDGVDIVTGPENGDPAAVVFDGVKKAKEEGYDVLFVDTAGRLQNKVNLMNELAKMKRILTREIPDAPHEVLLVLDATTGQNALNQAKLFKESTDVTGIVLTKLDGTARGGIVLAIRNELHLPVKFVGLGEKVDDLQEFNASEFVYGLFKGLVTTD